MEKYGAMEKNIVLWTKLWYYAENYETLHYFSFLIFQPHFDYRRKNMKRFTMEKLAKTKKLWTILEKTPITYQNN